MKRCHECKHFKFKPLEPKFHFYGKCKSTKLLVLPSRITAMPIEIGKIQCNNFVDRSEK